MRWSFWAGRKALAAEGHVGGRARFFGFWRELEVVGQSEIRRSANLRCFVRAQNARDWRRGEFGGRGFDVSLIRGGRDLG